MSSFKIVMINFKRNFRTYGLYIMSMIFSVATYYNFLSMSFNPQFQDTKEISMYVSIASGAATFFMTLFLVFFIIYSSNFFLNQRKKEIGLYSFMGVDNKKIGVIFASEGLLLGSISVVLGIFIGIICSKLFLMIMGKVAILNMTFDFFISKKAIFITIVNYGIVLGFSFMKGYISIVKSSLIDLLNAAKREETLPKLNYLKGISSIIILGLAYYVALNYKGLGFNLSLYGAIILIVIGTYWFFGSFLSILIRKFINNKSFLYKDKNIVSYTNIAFRIKDNYRTLAAVAVLITACLTSFGTVSSIKYFVKENRTIEAPYTLSFIEKSEQDIKNVEKVINDLDYDIKLKKELNFINVDEGYSVIKSSDFKSLVEDLEVDNKEKLISKFDMNSGEIGYVESPGLVMSLIGQRDVKINGRTYPVEVTGKAPVMGISMAKSTLVINDLDYNNLRKDHVEERFFGFNFNNQVDEEKLILNALPFLTEENRMGSTFLLDTSFYNFAGIIYFLGGFLSFVLIFATGSIIYFKILSESYKDINKFKIIKSIGTSNKEIYKIVSKQVRLLYLFPLILGIIHSSVAIYVLSMLMNYMLIIPTIISIVVFITIYGMFYIYTTKKYIRIIDR